METILPNRIGPFSAAGNACPKTDIHTYAKTGAFNQSGENAESRIGTESQEEHVEQHTSANKKAEHAGLLANIRKNVWTWAASAALVGFTTFVLLDTFALERVDQAVQASDFSSVVAAQEQADKSQSGASGATGANESSSQGSATEASSNPVSGSNADSGSIAAAGSNSSSGAESESGSGNGRNGKTDDKAIAAGNPDSESDSSTSSTSSDNDNAASGSDAGNTSESNAASSHSKPTHAHGKGKKGGPHSYSRSTGSEDSSGSSRPKGTGSSSSSESKSAGSSSSNSSSSATTDASAVVAGAASATSAGTQIGSYSDENMQISVSKVRAYETDIYVADVQVSSAEYLKTALAQNSFGRNLKDTTSNMAESANAVLAINGDYYGFRDDGYVLRNGVLYRDAAASGTDALVIYGDGTMASASQDEVSAEDLKQSGAWQVLSFGPVLVEDSAIAVTADEEVGQSKSSNPRTAIGMISPLHYVVVVSDGRTDNNEGLSLYELSQVLIDNGATFAYNLDGGGSTTLYFKGEVLNNPTSGNVGGERKVSDIVYFG